MWSCRYLALVLVLNGTTINLQTLFLAVSGATSAGGIELTSSVGPNGGTLPAAYTCDGTGSTLALAWTGAPASTKEFAVLMTTLPGDGTTKDSFVIGALGVGSDGPGTIYNPPCSQGPGAKVYTYSVYALSGSPSLVVQAAQVAGLREDR